MLALTVSLPCHAQTSVTLYGLLDNSLAYVSNIKGGRTFMQFAGDAQADRWGLNGEEDIGGGTKAVFRIESGFTMSNGALGQGGLLFGRQAYVGLTNDRFGTLTLGRQYDFMLDYLCPMAAGCANASVYAFHPGDYDRVGGERVDSAIKYSSVQYGGLRFGALYGFGNRPGSLARNSTYSFGAGYQNGAFQVGAAFTQIRNATLSFDIGAPVFGASLAGATVDRTSTAGIGASYSVGAIDVRALGTFVEFVRAGETATLRTAESSLTWRITPFLRVSGDYAYSTMTGAHWSQIGLMGNYFLSKRTDLYVHLITLRASSGVHAALFPLSPSSNDTQTLASIGIRHKF